MNAIQLSMFGNDNTEEVNWLITAFSVIESHVDAFKSSGLEMDQDWLEDYCYTVLLENEKETI